MLDLKTLQNAFSKIEEVGKGELTFDLDGIPVTLRVLLPSEEITVQKFAAQAMAEGDDTDASTTADYLERFKQAVCSHALVAVGELDFRGVEFVETGETLDNGVAIKVPKHQAVRDILSNFSRGATTIIFKKYGELLAQVEQDAEAATDFEIPDLDAEIKRLQDRITELEETKAEEEGKAPMGVMDSAVNTAIKAQGEDYERAKEWGDELRSQQQAQVEADQRIAKMRQASEEGLKPEESAEPAETSPTPTVRQPVSPTHATPPPERQESDAPEMTKEDVLAKVEEMSSEEPPSPTFSSQNTFIGDDPESQLQAENERMAQVRATRAKQQSQLRKQGTTVSAARKAPHLAAKEVADQMTGNDAVVQVGSIDGIPAYSMGEPQELHDKVGGGQEPPVVDQSNTKKGTVNPRFRRPK